MTGTARSGDGPSRARISCLADVGVVADLPDRAAARHLALAVQALGGLATGEAGGGPAAPGWSGIDDVVTTLRSVTVAVDPAAGDARQLAASMAALLRALGVEVEVAGVALPETPAPGAGPPGVALPETPAPGADGDGGTGTWLARAGRSALRGPGAGPVRVLPVRFDGDDLAAVALQLGCSEGAVVDLLVSSVLEVAFVGFAPGFAYLTGLPEPLASLARLDAPRARVPAGAVAVAGGFAAVYPQASPGGWNLLGTTDATLFDPSTPPYALLGPGDRVRFEPARPRVAAGPARDGRRHAQVPSAGPRPPWSVGGAGDRALVVESAGPCTTVQDGGRRGVAGTGVPGAGAADPFALRLANRLVGNDGDAPALEVTVLGPVLRFEAPAHVALVGDAPMTVDGLAVPPATPVPVAAGQRLQVGRCRSGARAVLAVGGGLVAPQLLGSAASDLLSGLGLGPLVAGDRLGIGPSGRPRGRLQLALHPGHDLAPWAARVGLTAGPVPAAVVRTCAGPDAGARTTAWLTEQPWVVGPDSDRVGLRLRRVPAPPEPGAAAPGAAPPAAAPRPAPPGPTAEPAPPAEALAPAGVSRGVVTGTVQLPPGGEPVVLLCDHATVGGYPVVAVVASVDVPLVAQLRPGDEVRLQPVDEAEAAAARTRAERALAEAVTGSYPVHAG